MVNRIKSQKGCSVKKRKERNMVLGKKERKGAKQGLIKREPLRRIRFF